jgi:hypothetical protein
MHSLSSLAKPFTSFGGELSVDTEKLISIQLLTLRRALQSRGQTLVNMKTLTGYLFNDKFPII